MYAVGGYTSGIYNRKHMLCVSRIISVKTDYLV